MNKTESKTQLVNKLDNLLILGWEDCMGHYMVMEYEIDKNGYHSYWYDLSRDERENMEDWLLEYIWNEFRNNHPEKEKYDKSLSEDGFDGEWFIDGMIHGFSNEFNNTCSLSEKISEYISNNYKDLGLKRNEEE